MTIPANAGLDDIAARSVLASYDVGTVLSVDRLATGGPAVRKVTTTVGAYLLKPAGPRAEVELLAELPALAVHGVRQPMLIRTRTGDLVSPDGYFLQEFLAGRPELEPSDAQVRAVMRAVGDLHVALGQLSSDYEPERNSVFVRVTDSGFLIEELPGLLRHYKLATGPADTAIAYLAENQAALDKLPRQLVHGDIGPDNVLMDDDQVVAIIDFTPHVLPLLFAASTALYWYHVYGQQEIPAADLTTSLATSLTASRATLAQVRPWTPAEDELWIAGLIWEALRRLATTLELARRARTDPGPTTRARIAAVKAVTPLIP